MNPLLAGHPFRGYFSADEYEFVLPDPTDPAGQEATAQLNQKGLRRLTSDLAALFEPLCKPDLLIPLRFISTSIQKMIDSSSASESIKKTLNDQTLLDVNFRPDLPKGLVRQFHRVRETYRIAHSAGHTGRFPLDQIFTSARRRELIAARTIQVAWPNTFAQDLINRLASANFPALYKAEIKRHLARPEARIVQTLQYRIELENRLRWYADRSWAPDEYKELAQSYFRQEAKVQLVESGSPAGRVEATNMLYLHDPANDAIGGLLIFLNEPHWKSTVVLPKEFAKEFVESTPWLQQWIRESLPLHHQFSHASATSSSIKLLATLKFRDASDALEELASIKSRRMLSDLDVLISFPTTLSEERRTEIMAAILADLFLIPNLPVSPDALVSGMLLEFLAQSSVRKLRTLRATSPHDFEQAEAHIYQEVAFMLSKMIPPILVDRFDLRLPPESESQIAEAVFMHLIKVAGETTLTGSQLELNDAAQPVNYSEPKPKPKPERRDDGWEILMMD